ncbi:MAG TPA: PQQ-binding-like beta-propeller repeat protein, partial [Solimonas sp.]|nr:PQQ-binding-like beta-propeller repeat protein [Solimonas sp.]
PPAGDGDVVVARAGDGKIYGLSAASGTRLWVYDSSVPNLTLRGLSMPQVSGNRVFAGLDNGRVAALRLGDGQPAWEQVVAAPTGRNELERLTDVDAIVLVDGPEVFAVSFGGEIVCLAADSGRVIWRRSVKSYSGIARLGDLVVVTDDAGVVWGLEAQSGAAVWKNEDLAWRKLSAPAVYRGSLVVGDYKGYLHWLDPKDGRIVARSRAGSDPIQAAPVAQSDILYVLGTGGRLTALRVN